MCPGNLLRWICRQPTLYSSFSIRHHTIFIFAWPNHIHLLLLTTKLTGTSFSEVVLFSAMFVCLSVRLSTPCWYSCAIVTVVFCSSVYMLMTVVSVPACICWLFQCQHVHRVSKKLCKLIFCQNFAKFQPIVKIFGTKIAERTSFSGVYSFSTSPNLCQRTTVWNADVQNCYLKL